MAKLPPLTNFPWPSRSFFFFPLTRLHLTTNVPRHRRSPLITMKIRAPPRAHLPRVRAFANHSAGAWTRKRLFGRPSGTMDADFKSLRMTTFVLWLFFYSYGLCANCATGNWQGLRSFFFAWGQPCVASNCLVGEPRGMLFISSWRGSLFAVIAG